MQIIRSIQNRIYELRGTRIMLDFDLATLYEVETRVLNQAVKRNMERFPEDFMFQLTIAEYESIRLQIDAINQGMSSQIVMTYPAKRPNTSVPFAFTEQGVAMLSSVLHSKKAIEMNVAIMRVFVEIRRMAMLNGELTHQLKELQQRIGEHDVQLSQIYDAIENLLDGKAAQRKWEERERIGFKK
ncbi:MAG: ORF6N domain-containing protein [Chitinophagaceae bacterium]|nr:MAG: ORF6N domain-containing protein [Chitinophagaceae bacterium]